MIFTHCGKMGDMFQCLPILSAWYKETGDKPTLVLAKFPFAKQSEELLRMQECIGDVVYVDYTPVHFGLGGQPYKFELRSYMDTSEGFYQLGFDKFPDCEFGKYPALEYGLKFDENFVLNIGESKFKYRNKTVVLDRFDDDVMAKKGIKGEYLPKSNSMIKNLQLAKGASVVRTYNTGSAILLLMAGINCFVYGPEHLKELNENLVYKGLLGKARWLNI